MNRQDYRSLSDDGLGDVLMMQQRVDALQATVKEQQDTIDQLQRDNRELRAAVGGDVVEVRRQLAESEQMRAAVSSELQQLRDRLYGCLDMAANGIRSELQMLEALDVRCYLNGSGVERVAMLRDWLELYEGK